jgi:hypothetical protein
LRPGRSIFTQTCLTCSTIATNCVTCGPGKYWVSGTCPVLPSNLYRWLSSAITRNCFPTCTSCSSSEYNKCLGCYPNFVPVVSKADAIANLDTFSCETECPSTHYRGFAYKATTATFCLPCEVLITNCVKCFLETAVAKPICQRCRAGFYVVIDTATFFTNSCDICATDCLECADKPNNCIACHAGKVLSFDTATGLYGCVADPKTLPVTNRVCSYHKYLYQGQCLDSCPVGTYRRKYYTDDCTSCDIATDGCFSCNSQTAVCTTCQPTSKKNLANTCYPCDHNLLQCCDVSMGTSSGTCSACSDINSSKCIVPSYSTTCNAGFVKNLNGLCTAVLANCAAYNYLASSCVLCAATHKLSGGSCVAACGGSLKQFVSTAAVTCEDCDPLCSTGSCTLPLTNNRCSACPTGHFLTTKGCKRCAGFVTGS